MIDFIIGNSLNCLKNRNVNILSKINITGTVQVLVAHSVPNNNENNSPEEIKNLVKFKLLTLLLNITTNKFMKSINIGIEIIWGCRSEKINEKNGNSLIS